VVELCERAALALEAGETIRIVGQVLGQGLDGDVALQSHVAAEVDHAHAAAADLARDVVRTDSSGGVVAHGGDCNSAPPWRSSSVAR
jgi:hypothetical protein